MSSKNLLILSIVIQLSTNFTLIGQISSDRDTLYSNSYQDQDRRPMSTNQNHIGLKDRKERTSYNQRDQNETTFLIIQRDKKQNIFRSLRDLRQQIQKAQNEAKQQNTSLSNSKKLKIKQSFSSPRKLTQYTRNLQSTKCSIANCNQCTSYSSLNPNFTLQANDFYPNNDHPLYTQEFCNICDDGYFLYRHPLIQEQLSLFINSNYTQIDGLVSTLSNALAPQESCIINSQKIIQASIRILKLNIDSYMDQPDFFKTWLLSVMQKYQIKPENFNLLFAQQGSLILKYWFNVKNDFQPEGNVTNDVFNSQIEQTYQGSKVQDFEISEVKNVYGSEKPSQSQVIPSPSQQILSKNQQKSSQAQQTSSQSQQSSFQESLPKVDPSQNSRSGTGQKSTISITSQDILTSTAVSPSDKSNSPNMIAIIVVGVLSAILLSGTYLFHEVAAIYMLCIRKNKEEQEEENKENQENQVKDEIKPTSVIVIKDGTVQNQNQKTKNEQNNQKQTSILKHNKSVIAKDNKGPEQKTQSFFSRILSFLSRKPINEVDSYKKTKPKLPSNQIQSMEDLVKSNSIENNIESNKPLGKVPEFI